MDPDDRLPAGLRPARVMMWINASGTFVVTPVADHDAPDRPRSHGEQS